MLEYQAPQGRVRRPMCWLGRVPQVCAGVAGAAMLVYAAMAGNSLETAVLLFHVCSRTLLVAAPLAALTGIASLVHGPPDRRGSVCGTCVGVLLCCLIAFIAWAFRHGM